MRKKIGVTFILFVLLGTMAMPMVIAADSDKTIIKEMVQAPAEYSVSLMPDDYLMHWAERYYTNYDDYPRHVWSDYRFYRLGMPNGQEFV